MSQLAYFLHARPLDSRWTEGLGRSALNSHNGQPPCILQKNISDIKQNIWLSLFPQYKIRHKL